MARTQTMVQLTDRLVGELDEEATRLNLSRSALIRQAIDDFLSARRTSDAVERYIDGYRQTPQATPDEWGDLSEDNGQSGLDLAKRLDAEEAERGLEW